MNSAKSIISAVVSILVVVLMLAGCARPAEVQIPQDSGGWVYDDSVTGSGDSNGTGGLNQTKGGGITGGINGDNGTGDSNGTDGAGGTGGASGANGTGGSNGTGSTSGTGDSGGADGTSGTNGAGGNDGTGGTGGTSGTGSSGTSGSSGTGGTGSAGTTATTITISYNANGGSGAPGAQTATTTAGKSVSIKLSSTKPTRNGYDFKGWATGSGATSAAYQPGTAYSFGASATIYAVWAATAPLNVTVSITYNANGGSGGPGTQTGTAGKNLTLSSARPTRSGFTFAGWGTSSGATSVAYQPGGSYTFSASTTLYALWSKTITITYNANGGSGAPAPQTVTAITSGGILIHLSAYMPTRSGYTFAAWSTSSSSSATCFAADAYITFYTDVTLYAFWSAAAAPPTIDGGTWRVSVGEQLALPLPLEVLGAMGEHGGGIYWAGVASSNPNVASVNWNYYEYTVTVTGREKGTAYITLNVDFVDGWGSATVTYRVDVV